MPAITNAPRTASESTPPAVVVPTRDACPGGGFAGEIVGGGTASDRGAESCTDHLAAWVRAMATALHRDAGGAISSKAPFVCGRTARRARGWRGGRQGRPQAQG